MRFNHLGHDITLRAYVSIGPEPTYAAQLKRLLHTGSTSALYSPNNRSSLPIAPLPKE